MIVEILMLLAGFVLLIKGSDYFVEASSRIARRLGISQFIIGLTLVAVGTSIPELASSITAALKGYPEIIAGNLVGSNIANIGLIIGVAAIIRSLKTRKRMHERDGYILLFSGILFFAMGYDGVISSFDGIILLLFYGAYVMFLLHTGESKDVRHRFRDFLDFVFGFGYLKRRKSKLKDVVHPPTDIPGALSMDMIIVVLSLVAVVFGAKFLIDGAVWVAGSLNIPRNLIGLSMVAVGTSLPELTVSIQAARKGMGHLVVGNVIGSNIANTLLIFGISSFFTPIAISLLSLTYIIPIMLFFTLFFVYSIRLGWKIRHGTGVFLVASYLLFMALAFFYGLA